MFISKGSRERIAVCYRIVLLENIIVENRDPKKLAAPSPSVKVYTSKEVAYACLYLYNCKLSTG